MSNGSEKFHFGYEKWKLSARPLGRTVLLPSPQTHRIAKAYRVPDVLSACLSSSCRVSMSASYLSCAAAVNVITGFRSGITLNVGDARNADPEFWSSCWNS